MAAKNPTYTPVRGTRGKVIHAFTPGRLMETACGIAMESRGWHVCELEELLGCDGCKAAVAHPRSQRRRVP